MRAAGQKAHGALLFQAGSADAQVRKPTAQRVVEVHDAMIFLADDVDKGKGKTVQNVPCGLAVLMQERGRALLTNMLAYKFGQQGERVHFLLRPDSRPPARYQTDVAHLRAFADDCAVQNGCGLGIAQKRPVFSGEG